MKLIYDFLIRETVIDCGMLIHIKIELGPIRVARELIGVGIRRSITRAYCFTSQEKLYLYNIIFIPNTNEFIV